MACQTSDLSAAFAGDGAQWSLLRIDGGMSVNTWMAQDIADVLNVPVERPDYVETTALGAGILAAAGCGLFDNVQAAVSTMRGGVIRFEPAMAQDIRAERLKVWKAAVAAI